MKSNDKYEIVKLGRRYVIRKWHVSTFLADEWKYYDEKGSYHWWSPEYVHNATRYWTQNGALKALERLIEGPKVVFAIGGDDDLV